MAQYTKTEVRRITFLSLLGSASQFADEPYETAHDWLQQMEGDGFFDETIGGSGNSGSGGRSGSSRKRESNSRSGKSGRQRGRDRARGNGSFQIKDPEAPATKSQVGKLLSLTDDYTWEEAEEMTKGEISDLIEDLV